MTAGEIRQHIALVESYHQKIHEVDATRRGLFKSAAALAAVAALPPQAKAQAAELIKSNGTELMQAAIDAVKHGVNRNDIYFVIDMLHYYGEEVHPLDLFPSKRRNDAIAHVLGTDPAGVDEEAEQQFMDVLYKMSTDERMELLRKIWSAVGLGHDPSWYHYYLMTKRYPNLLGRLNADEDWNLLRDFLPKDRDRHGYYQHSEPQTGIDAIKMELEYRKNQLHKWVDAPWLRPEINRLEKLVRDHEIAHKHGMSQSLSGAGKSTAVMPDTSAPPVTKKQMLAQVLSAVDTLLKAFKRVDQVSNVALDVLKDLTPKDIKVTMQRDAGQEPEAPQQPAALPAPEPRINLGLDRQQQPLEAPKKA